MIDLEFLLREAWFVLSLAIELTVVLGVGFMVAVYLITRKITQKDGDQKGGKQ